ncbi:MAG: beta-N-acetylhexosaminidase [Clostridia bacterium]|nr:beta-N-acetylhexosaminidase [Clostridia bacterium]
MERNLVWKAGQRFVAGFHGTEIPEDFKQLVREHKVGNVILFKRNVVDAQQLKKLCDELQELIMAETGLPAFITIDQEGGAVTRLSEDCPNTAGAMALASTGNVENAYQAGLITGRELNAIGVNFDLAPVMDVNSNPNNAVVGVRSFGDQPETVATYGSAWIRGLEQNAISCAKHFPGHGDTDIDTHLDLPTVDLSLEELEKRDLVPFKAAIEAGVSAIMTTHILFPQIEKGGVPATMSKTIMQDVLRGKLGFKGIIISDCMMMQAIANYYGTVPGALAAVNAGVDLICICHDPALTGQACEKIVAEADEAMMDESIARIVAAKEALAKRERLPMSAATDPDALRTAVQQREASVCLVGAEEVPAVGGNPFFVGCYPFHTSQAVDQLSRFTGFTQYMQHELGGTEMTTPVLPEEKDIQQAVEAAKGASSVVLCTYNAHIRRSQLDLMRALAALGKPMIVCAMGAPYDLSDLPEGVCGLTAFEYTVDMLRILRDVMTGAIKPEGTLSVKL